jgi:hypothetical protein
MKKRLHSHVAAVASHASKKTCKKAVKTVKRAKTASHASHANAQNAQNEVSVTIKTSVAKPLPSNALAMSAQSVQNVSHVKKHLLPLQKHC